MTQSIAIDMSLTPLARKVLNHLEKRGSISHMEFLSTYGFRHLADCIYKIRELGYDVLTERRKDEAGKPYVRYFRGWEV